MMSWFLECLEGKINIKSVINHRGITGILRQTRMTKRRQSTMAEMEKKSIENLLFMETGDQQLILFVSNQMVRMYRSISPAL